MRMHGLIAAALMAGAMAANPMSLAGFRVEPPRSAGQLRRIYRGPRSKYDPHSGAKERAKHMARLARGIVECAAHEGAPLQLAMAA